LESSSINGNVGGNSISSCGFFAFAVVVMVVVVVVLLVVMVIEVVVVVVVVVVAVIVVLILPTAAAAIVQNKFLSCYINLLLCDFHLLNVVFLSFSQRYWINLKVYRSNTVPLFKISLLVYSGGTVLHNTVHLQVQLWTCTCGIWLCSVWVSATVVSWCGVLVCKTNRHILGCHRASLLWCTFSACNLILCTFYRMNCFFLFAME
jgi:hypothetical protein